MTIRMKSILLLAACAAALTGCAGTATAVRASAEPGFGATERTYAFAEDTGVPGNGKGRALQSAVERRLTELGFVAAPPQSARYRLALSHDTHPASVGVDYSGCAGGVSCGFADTGRTPGFPWPGAIAYVHSLTLRFFDRTDGKEAYKVSATKRDRDADSPLAAGYLVAGALARLPFGESQAANQTGANANEPAGAADWKVTLEEVQPGPHPRVTGVSPLRK